MFNILLKNLRYLVATSKFQSFKDVPLQKHEVKTNFMRSSGPGGQSVNTTNSKAEIRISLDQCQAIDDFISQNLKIKYKNYINKENQLVIRSQVHKSQTSNLQDCFIKAKKIIYQCSLVPEERRFDIPAETEEIRQKRLDSKKKKSQVKSRRQNKDW